MRRCVFSYVLHNSSGGAAATAAVAIADAYTNAIAIATAAAAAAAVAGGVSGQSALLILRLGWCTVCAAALAAAAAAVAAGPTMRLLRSQLVKPSSIRYYLASGNRNTNCNISIVD